MHKKNSSENHVNFDAEKVRKSMLKCIKNGVKNRRKTFRKSMPKKIVKISEILQNNNVSGRPEYAQSVELSTENKVLRVAAKSTKKDTKINETIIPKPCKKRCQEIDRKMIPKWHEIYAKRDANNCTKIKKIRKMVVGKMYRTMLRNF